MKDEGLTVKELIEELQKLPQDNKIYVNKWFRRKGSIIEWASYSVKATGITEAIEMDTNKTVYSIETECKDIEDILRASMKSGTINYPITDEFIGESSLKLDGEY